MSPVLLHFINNLESAYINNLYARKLTTPKNKNKSNIYFYLDEYELLFGILFLREFLIQANG